MEFTGERFMPECRGDIAVEHWHRYLLASLFAQDKDVLDIASGEGYGSALLARTAGSVVGVDISAEAVAHAQHTYSAPNMRFVQGSVTAIPLDTASIDLAVSFETIEHLTEHEEMLREIKRVLRPDGLLLISSPDKYEYSDRTGFANDYHIKELYRNEFEALLQACFQHCRILGQRIVFGSVMGSETDAPFFSWRMSDPELQTTGLADPAYCIALAGDRELPPLPAGILQTPVRDSDCASSLAMMLEQAKSDYGTRIGQLESRVECLENQRECLKKELAEVHASRSWRITRPLRQIAGVLRALRRRSV